MKLEVDTNIEQFLKNIKHVRNDQLPYAMAKALNTNAFRIQKNLQSSYAGVFKVRSKGMPKLIRIDKADKKTTQFRVHLEKPFMVNQAEGGIKEAKPGRSVPVAAPKLLEQGLTPSGKLKPAYYVTAQLAKAEATKRTRKRVRTNKEGKKTIQTTVEHRPAIRKDNHYQPFEMISKKNGMKYIARHIPGNKEDLEWLYALKPEQEVKKRWDWEKIVSTSYHRHIEKDFQEALAAAMASPKKKS